MAEATTTIINNGKDIYDIMDTALKIGLGALIGGVFSFITSKSSHKHEISKEKFIQKTKILQDTNNEFNTLTNGAYYFLDFHISALTQKVKTTNNLQDIDKINYELIEKEYNLSNSKIPLLKSNLNLLNISEALHILKTFDRIMSKYKRDFIENNNTFSTKIEIEETLNKILVLEEKYNSIISNYYANLK